MKPLLLHYFITNRCNAQCRFCDIWKTQPKIDADTEQVLLNLSEAKKAGCRFVDFTGGEPLLHPDLPLYLKKAREYGFITSVTTNALLFPQRARELAGCIDLLHFSIDADIKELNDSIHGVKTFDSVMESIPIALKNRLIPDLLFTYSDDNIDHFLGIGNYAREKKLMIILDPVFSLDGKETVSAATHQKAFEYSSLPGVYLNKAHIALREQGGNRIGEPYCKAVSSTLVILPDNTLALPCFHHCTEKIALKPSFVCALNHIHRLAALKNQGRYPFCSGCHINCYFDPSYSFLRNELFIKSIAAKFRYAVRKYFLYKRPINFIFQKF